MTNQDLVELASRLWAQHHENLDFLMEHRPEVGDGIAGFLLECRDEICRRLAGAGDRDRQCDAPAHPICGDGFG